MNIINPNLSQLEDISNLFNDYRIFYQQKSDIDRAKKFIKARIENQDSVIFMAIEDKEALGFVQLYPTLGSISTGKIYVLNDLYIKPNYRGKGIGRALMHIAKNFAKEKGAVKLILKTGKHNHIAQALYESEGYKRDEDFVNYELTL